MKYSEVSNRLQNLINYTPTQSEFCIITGVKQSTMSNRASRDSDFTTDEIIKINQFFDVNLFTNTLHYNDTFDDNNHYTLDYYPDVFGSCGNGVFQFSTKREQITVPKNVILKNLTPGKQYFVINAYGNSMEPYIYDNDKLVVENYDGEQIIDNTPYVFAYQDEIFIKRLSKNVDQLIITSDNPIYDARKLTGAQLKDVNIIGQIVGLMRDLR